jgi:hypothetical protein
VNTLGKKRMMTNILFFVMIVGGIKRRENTIKKTYSSFGRTNYLKNQLKKSGLKNIKDQLTVITQKDLVKRRIAKVERKKTNV